MWLSGRVFERELENLPMWGLVFVWAGTFWLTFLFSSRIPPSFLACRWHKSAPLYHTENILVCDTQ